MQQCLLKELHSNINVRQAFNKLYDCVDNLLIEGKFDTVKNAMNNVVEEPLPLVFLIGLLTITLPWRKQLGKSRKELIDITRIVAYRDYRDPNALLSGLI